MHVKGLPLGRGNSEALHMGLDYQTTALIYEYRKITTNQVAPSRPGRLDARTHLTNSGIYQALLR